MDAAAATFDDVEKATAWLEAAAKGDDPLLHSIGALNVLRNRAVADPMMAKHAAALAPRLEKALLLQTASSLSADIEGRVSVDEIVIGLGCAAALVARDEDEFRVDRILHLGKLVAKLTVVLHERALTERGDPLTRAIAIRRAADSLPVGTVQ